MARRPKWSRVILVARFLYFCLELGITKALGVLVPALDVQLRTSYANIGVITSLSMSTMYLASPLARLLLDHVNPRFVTSVSGLTAGVAMICTAFTRNILVLAVLFFITGFCCAVVNLQAIVLLHQYFVEDFAFISTVTLLGIPVGAMFLPPITSLLLESYGVSGTLFVLGALVLNILPIGLALKDRADISKRDLNSNKETQTKIRPSSSEENLKEIQNNNEKGSPTLSGVILSCVRFLHLDIFYKEPLFCGVCLPAVLLLFLVTGGWALFIVLYGVTYGLDEVTASFLSTSGAVGGVISQIVASFLLRFRPQWCYHMFTGSLCLSALTFFLQTVNSSFAFLLVTSFIIGFGLIGANVTIEAVMALSVSKENFPDTSSIFYFIVGLGYLSAGYVTGFVQDITGRMDLVFMFLGTTTAIAFFLMILFLACLRRLKRRRKYEYHSCENGGPHTA